MIEYIKGDIAEITPATVVLDCNGMGYGINISLNTYSAIQNQSNTKLYIYEAIREDAYVLYGFSTKQERELFLLLISVSGIGGNTARMILSALSPSELCGVISSGNDKFIENGERHRPENCPTHHSGLKGQDRHFGRGDGEQ